MFKRISMIASKRDVEQFKIEVVTHENGVNAHVDLDDHTYLSIDSNALSLFISKLEAAEQQINRIAKEHIEQIRLHRHCVVTDDDVMDEEIRERLRKNGTAV